jgi:CRISPR-associated endonuclease/helicase Cas3
MKSDRPDASPSLPPPAVTAEPLAHLDETGRPHLLVDHLSAVAQLAGLFAESFDAGAWARLAGRWHDLGKFGKEFQRRIRLENGFEAHIEGRGDARRDHSTAGAVHAKAHLGDQVAPMALVVAGHHAGLRDWSAVKERLAGGDARLADALGGGPPAELLRSSPLTLPARLREGDPREQRRHLEMWTRFLFSALCDADFLDTEAFYEPDRAALRGAVATPATLVRSLDARLEALESAALPTEVNRVRAEVLGACRDAASLPPGVFTLTVPTGGGKTLASMAFALAHAARHGLARVVVAIPYTSITEQNAAVYRQAVGEEHVLEHHSALEPQEETARSRVAAENWDAPVIVTTTVQLFESMFANRPSRCRKLHRLARSVVVLDEAQTLPPGLLLPILDGLNSLVRDFGTTVVVCTATQPALGRSAWLPSGLDGAREIVPPEVRAFERLRRVEVRWPATREPTPYEVLAPEMADEPDVLAIVHRRRDARELCRLVDARLGHEHTLHLSALMCPAHRSEVLAQVRRRKADGEPVRLVSTQLVEAGVDLDFAVVYRALAGLDSLAQAAGRCNREGRLPTGELRVFIAPTRPPPGVPETAAAVTTLMLQAGRLDLLAAETYRTYFENLYRERDLDAHAIQGLREHLGFGEVAKAFCMIDDDWSASLVVPYGDARCHVEEVALLGPSRDRLRALQRYTIAVRLRDLDDWRRRGCVRDVADGVTVVDDLFAEAYDGRFGLMPECLGVIDPGALVIDG